MSDEKPAGARSPPHDSQTLEREPSGERVARAEASEASATDLVGRPLLHFRVVGRLGEGGMGIVYRAIDEKLRRPVALKVLSSRYLVDERNAALLFREARTAAALTHANIGAIHELHDETTPAFIVMELVAGETLRERIARAPLGIDEVLSIARAIASALACAHEAGIVHRDLKPDNVMIAAAGAAAQVKVLDFGLAKAAHEAEPIVSGDVAPRAVHALAPTVPASSRSTREGRVMGTPSYMSPEQSRGDHVDARTDVFAFGVVLYELLAGALPFERSSAEPWSWGAAGSGDWRVRAPLRRVRGEAPRALAEIVERCLAYDAGSRYAGGAALVEALAEVRVVPRGSRGRWLAVALLVAGGSVAAASIAWRSLHDRALAPSPPLPKPAAPAFPERVVDHELKGLPLESGHGFVALPGDRVVYVGDDGILWLLSLRSSSSTALFRGIALDRPYSVSTTRDGGIVLHANGTIWRIADDGTAAMLREAKASWKGVEVSPDGARLLVARDAVFRPGIATATGTDDARDLGDVYVSRWSPRGDAVALVTGALNTGWNLELRPVDGSPGTVVASSPRLYSRNSMAGVAWLSETTLLYVLEPSIPDHPDAELMAIELRGCTRVSEPRRVASWPGVDVTGFDDVDGRLQGTKLRLQDDVVVATLRADGRAFAGDPTPMTTMASNDAPVAWLPDGRLILLSDRSGQVQLLAQRPGDRNLQVLVDEHPAVRTVIGSRDGTVWYWVNDPDRPAATRVALKQLAPGASVARELYRAPADSPGDGRKLAYGAEVYRRGGLTVACETIGARARFSEVDATTGERIREVGRTDGACLQRWTITPDDETVLHGANEALQSLRIATGEVRNLEPHPDSTWVQNVTIGSGGLEYWTGYAAGAAHIFLRNPGERFESIWTDRTAFWFGAPVVSPDGRRLALDVRRRQESVWWFELQ